MDVFQSDVTVCIFKNVTAIPCPACGSTRSVIFLSEGKFINALLTNPLGYVIALSMLISPIWIFFDVLTQKSTLYIRYQNIEKKIKQPKIAIPIILLLLMNWIWNIYKNL